MNKHPHYAQINFRIDIFKVNQDGSLDPKKITEHEMEAFGITPNAIFGIQGFNLEDCVNKLKQALGALKYDE